MDITKIIGIAFVTVFISIILKQYRPEFSIYISIIAGIIILFYISGKISTIIILLQNISSKAGIDNDFLLILIKITGIAYLSEFASNICKDSGETAIASKVEFAGRVLIVALSIPILSTLLETMMKLV